MTACGSEPNTSLFKFILPTPLGNKNYVEVDRTLQVRAHQSIFAAGDIVNVHETKQFAKSTAHAKIVAANIISYLKDEPLLKGYKPGNDVIAVSNGKVRRVASCTTLYSNILFRADRRAALPTSACFGVYTLVTRSPR